VFSVIYYPGTALHTLAVQDGLVYDEKAEIYDRMFSERHDSYTNTLLFLARSGKMPTPVLKAAIHPGVVAFATSDYAAPLGDVAQSALRTFRRVARNPSLSRARALGSWATFEARLTGMTGADAGAVAPDSGAHLSTSGL
jgi:hypothetical protein